MTDTEVTSHGSSESTWIASRDAGAPTADGAVGANGVRQVLHSRAARLGAEPHDAAQPEGPVIAPDLLLAPAFDDERRREIARAQVRATLAGPWLRSLVAFLD